jgi:hypothetical protein
MIITVEHMRTVPNLPRPGLCVRGAIAWFASYGLDFGQFCKHGLPEETLLATGDPFAIRVVAHAKGESHGR